MTQETEIEKKNLLTENEFHVISEANHIKQSDYFWQANTYFDTSDGGIKEQGGALRIREKNSMYELTLKQPAESGLLETNQALTTKEAELTLSTAGLPDGEVKQQLISSLSIDVNDLRLLGTLRTYRAQTPFKDGILFLDHSLYLDTEDFELEIEGPSETDVQQWLNEILSNHNIPLRPTPNKIKRFFLRKQELEGKNNQ